MIVFDLKCDASSHVFEVWFGSSQDYEQQKARGLIACPYCGDTSIEKAIMAPAIGAKSNSAPAGAPVGAASADTATIRAMMTKIAQAQEKVLENSTWVGRGFADQARAMHYGEQDRKSIHGEVAPAEARALVEEGVPVAPLPLPVVPPEAKN
jgi:hypothetical protein